MSEIFSSKITKGPRTYFFDIRKNERGDYYLTITETKKSFSGNDFERRRIMVFEEDMLDFVESLQVTLDELKKYSKYDF